MPTKGSAAPAACLPAPAPAAAAALPAPWPASDSPAVQPQPPRLSPGSGHGARPITPDPAPAQAAATPDASRAASAGAGAAAGAAARQARAREQREQERWCRVESFVRHVTTSPLIHSALCSLLDGVSGEADGETDGEADGEADAELPHGDTLQLALAQMLALFLRAGYPTGECGAGRAAACSPGWRGAFSARHARMRPAPSRPAWAACAGGLVPRAPLARLQPATRRC